MLLHSLLQVHQSCIAAVYPQTFAAVSQGPGELAIAVSSKRTIVIALDPPGVCLYRVLSSFLSLEGLIKLQESIGQVGMVLGIAGVCCYGCFVAL